MAVLNNGNVGIGTSDPASRLSVAGSVTAANTALVSGELANAPLSGTCLGQENNENQAVLQSSEDLNETNIFYNASKSKHARIALVTRCVDGTDAVWQILTLTDMIIGNTVSDSFVVYTPAGDLGNSSSGFFNNLYAIKANFVSATIAGGFDIAEEYQTKDETIAAGDLVSADPENPSQIIKAASPDDAKLLGAVSTNPGILLGDETIGIWRKVALAGRILVKVSTENGPIAIGDAITVSSIPGVGAKAMEPGYVVGKALEEFDPANGKGKIEICPAPSATQGQLLGRAKQPIVCGRISMFINTSWFNGQLNNVGLIGPDQQSQTTILSAFAETVKAALAEMGLIMQNGVASLREVIAGKVTTQTAKMDKMEMVDNATGELYCTWIENGEWKKVKGSCEDSQVEQNIPQSGSSILTVPIPLESPLEPSVSTEPSITPNSTPEVVPESSPEPVSEPVSEPVQAESAPAPVESAPVPVAESAPAPVESAPVPVAESAPAPAPVVEAQP